MLMPAYCRYHAICCYLMPACYLLLQLTIGTVRHAVTLIVRELHPVREHENDL